jgi:hypothetical protein
MKHKSYKTLKHFLLSWSDFLYLIILELLLHMTILCDTHTHTHTPLDSPGQEIGPSQKHAVHVTRFILIDISIFKTAVSCLPL